MKKLNYVIISFLSIGVLCFVANIVAQMFETTKSSMTPDGFLKEPFFFLIPIGYICIGIGLLALIFKLIMKFLRRPIS